MLAVFDKWGRRYPCTALQLDACQVVQVSGFNELLLVISIHALCSWVLSASAG
jgi:hypothetical protein